jgi:protein-S-isoprenylcysteine O-methyltransferase Ste14
MENNREASSPWWYQRRALVIWAVYLIGFFGGYPFTAAVDPKRALPSFAVLAVAFHWKAVVLLTSATLLTFAGWALRVWGSAYLRPEVVWNRDALRGRLLVDGPFRYVRNPLYLGNDLLAIGIGVLASPIGWAFIVAGNVAFGMMLAAHEAAGLRAAYGAVYDAYRARVPALIPRLTPAHVDGSATGQPSLMNGLRSEFLTLGLVLGMLAYLIAGRTNLLFIAILAGLVAQLTMRLRVTMQH